MRCVRQPVAIPLGWQLRLPSGGDRGGDQHVTELVDLFNDGNANEKSGTTASISKHAHGPHVRVAPKVDARVR
jgi:hypothetical protein